MKGLNEVEAEGNVLEFPTSVKGDLPAGGKGEAKPNPREEVRDAEGNCRAEGGCWVTGRDIAICEVANSGFRVNFGWVSTLQLGPIDS